MAKKYILVNPDSFFDSGEGVSRRRETSSVQDRLLSLLVKSIQKDEKKKEEEAKKKEMYKPRTYTVLEVFGMLCIALIPTGMLGSYAILLWLAHLKEVMNAVMK